MTICFVLEHYFPYVGGAETFFKNLIDRLVENGHRCYVVTSRLSGTKKYEEVNGVNIYRVSVPRRLGRYWFTVLSIPAVYKIAKGCDLLHTMTYNGAFPAFIVSRLLRKPAVITVFEVLLNLWKSLSGMNPLNGRLHALLERLVVTLPFDRYICISYYTRSYVRLCGIDDKRLTVIYPGVDQDLFSYQEEAGRLVREKLGLNKNFVYLYFGRPGFFKGVEFLIRAVPLISEKIPHAKLLLILSREPKGKYKQILSAIRELKIEDSLILLENMPVEELIRHISSCDCVVLPSLTEGFGFSCLEACSMGKPVVTTDVGAIPEVIFGRYVLVAPQSPEAICRGVQSVYSKEVVPQPKKIFDWKRCVAEYEKVYEDLKE